MSLDVYLTTPTDSDRSKPQRQVIFVRENGQTVEISRDEWDTRYPDRLPVIVTVGGDREEAAAFSANITHNLSPMAAEAGIYMHLWRPEELSISKARDLIYPLTDGLAKLQSDPERFEAMNPPNGWGSYKGFVPWVARYLEACSQYPNADVAVCR